LLCGLGAYVCWGFTPLLFKAVTGLGASEILALRLLGATLLLALVVSGLRRWGGVMTLVRQPRLLFGLSVTALLMLASWLTIIIAARTGHLLEASLGIFVTPLVNIALGMLVLGERLRPRQWLAVGLAACGVFPLFLGGGALWISLVTAISFAAYGLIRKILLVPALEALTVETAVLAPFAIVFLCVWPIANAEAYTAVNALLLAAIAFFTVSTLFLFAAAVRRLTYGTLGLIQYISPSIQFLLALAMGEAFRHTQAIAFGCIWVALAIYAAEGLRHHVRSSREPALAE
jgi:chloramphenicol-sensitive protein RarD